MELCQQRTLPFVVRRLVHTLQNNFHRKIRRLVDRMYCAKFAGDPWTLQFIAPRMFFGACEQPSTTLGVRPSGVLIMRKFWKPADADTTRKLGSGPVPEPGRCRYHCNLVPGQDFLGNANGICPKVDQKRPRMSVRPSSVRVTIYSFFK